MIQAFRAGDDRKITVYIDDYENGILRGRFYHAFHGSGNFESLAQFLLRMESILEETQVPQAYTAHRTFASMLPLEDYQNPTQLRKSAKATFEIRILFRQHSSWQGVIRWKDKNTEQRFRSVLELIFLLDSALRELEDSAAS